jgi:putative ABC transport system permease protein
MSRQQGGAAVRKTLTVIQFTVSTILVISSILIERQLDFFHHTDTGVNRSNVLAIPFSHTIGNHYPALKKDVRDLAGISNVATANYELYLSYNVFQADLGGGRSVSLVALNVDDQYIPLLDMQWKYPPIGPNIYLQDRGIIINETAIRTLQLPVNPVGHQITMDGDKKYTVAGVLKDFNYTSLHSKVDAACLLIDKDSAGRWGTVSNGCMMVKVKPGVNLPTTIESIKKIYEHYDITTPFTFDFLDETFAHRYDEESRLASILGVFTGLTVLIACLGLLGLAAFLATQKAKEVSIRKVLGASVQSLMLLLTKGFIRLVLIAIIIAIPISWYVMHRWLQNFAYKISIGWTVFAIAGGAALIISAFTISVEAFRSATADPAKNLRSE